jgi:predicted small lipoprotein YifL
LCFELPKGGVACSSKAELAFQRSREFLKTLVLLMKNQKVMKNCILIVCMAVSFGSFAGCQTKGPMEKAGEKVDEAVKDTKRAVEDVAD